MKNSSRFQTGLRAVEGQVMLLFALSSLVLIGAVAMAVDVGFLMAERRQVQAAADAGVMAAAHASLQNLSAAQIEAAGQDYGAVNADVDEGDVDVNRPPVSGEHAGDNDYVQVTITKDVQRFFVGAIYDGDWQVSASAVAVVEPSPMDVAMLALNSDAHGIKATGNTDIMIHGGSIVSNYALTATGNGTIEADQYVAANDGFDRTGTITFVGGSGTNEAAPEIPDPLAEKLSPPPLPAAPGSAANYYSGGSGISLVGNKTHTLNPGRYVFNGGPGISMTGNINLRFNAGTYEMWFTGGADISMIGNSQITSAPGAHVKMYFYGTSGNPSDLVLTGNADSDLPSGEYYFDRGSLRNTGNMEVSGDDMFFYFKNGGRIDVTGNGNYAFTATTDQIYDGYYPGVLFYSDRDNSAPFSWTGNAISGSTGAIYLPSTKVTVTGNSSGDMFEGQFIANGFQFTGNTNLEIRFREYVETGAPKVYLVE